MRLLNALRESWHSWRASRHALRYRYHADRALVLRERLPA